MISLYEQIQSLSAKQFRVLSGSRRGIKASLTMVDESGDSARKVGEQAQWIGIGSITL